MVLNLVHLFLFLAERRLAYKESEQGASRSGRAKVLAWMSRPVHRPFRVSTTSNSHPALEF